MGTRLGIKVSSISLLNSLSGILLLSLVGRGLIIRGYYIKIKLLIKANAAYSLKVS